MRSSTGRDRVFSIPRHPATCMRQRSAIRSISWPSCLEMGRLLRETSLRPRIGPELFPARGTLDARLHPALQALPLPPWRAACPPGEPLGDPTGTPRRARRQAPAMAVSCRLPGELRVLVSQDAPQIMQQSSHVTMLLLVQRLGSLDPAFGVLSTKSEPRLEPSLSGIHGRSWMIPQPQRTC